MKVYAAFITLYFITVITAIFIFLYYVIRYCFAIKANNKWNELFISFILFEILRARSSNVNVFPITNYFHKALATAMFIPVFVPIVFRVVSLALN